MTDPDLRASDAEREHHVELLREHAAQGRLTVDELDERLDRVYAARRSASCRRSSTNCRRRSSRAHRGAHRAAPAGRSSPPTSPST